MDKKVIIAIIAVILVAIIGAVLFLGSSETTLYAGDNYITLPSDYLVDENGVAYNNDTGVVFIPVVGGNASDQKMIFDTLKAKGKDAGYNNVTTTKINGYDVYEFSADPNKLKTVTTDKVISGNYETWKEISPYLPYKDLTDMDVVKYRYVGYIKDNKTNELYIFTNNTKTDLYSSDIEKIINSIAVAEE